MRGVSSRNLSVADGTVEGMEMHWCPTCRAERRMVQPFPGGECPDGHLECPDWICVECGTAFVFGWVAADAGTARPIRSRRSSAA